VHLVVNSCTGKEAQLEHLLWLLAVVEEQGGVEHHALAVAELVSSVEDAGVLV
jgi:hypothetical protein